MAGIFTGVVTRLPATGWIIAASAASLLVILENRWLQFRPLWIKFRRWLPIPLAVFLIGFFLGGLRGQSIHHPWTPEDLAFYNGDAKAELVGWVADYPDQRQSAILLRVRVESIQPQGKDPIPVKGDALLRLPPGNHWRYGDRVVVYGVPTIPPEDADFSYKDYLARQGIHTYLAYPAVRPIGTGAGSPLMAAIFRLREQAYATINRIFPFPEAALLSGVLLGLDKDLPDTIVSAFQDTGTAHIVAISGFNMSVLAALLIGMLGRFLPRGWSALAAAVTITFYTLLVGANPAVVRAAIMSSLALFGRLIGRGSSGTTPLAFSAAIMCLFNPLLLWDAGFQLSFTATLGLILYGEPLQLKFESWVENRWGDALAKRLTGPVSEYLLFTLAAQVMTLLVVLYHFGRLSFSAVLANPLILPVQPGVMILGGIALIAGMILPAVGQVLAWLAWPLATYTLRVVEWLAQLPFGATSVGVFTVWMGLAAYILLFTVTLNTNWVTRLRAKLKPGLVLAGLFLAVVIVWSAVLRRPDGRLHLTLLDMPAGQAGTLRLPNGGRVLIGGAEDANLLSSRLGKWTGPLDRHLDALILTSASANQLEGLPLLIERFPVEQAFWAVPPPDKKVAQRIRQSLIDARTPIVELTPGDRLELDEKIYLTILQADQNGAALQMEYGHLCVIWPGKFSPSQLSRTESRLDGCILISDQTIDQAAWAELHPFQYVFFDAAPIDMQGALATAAHGQIELTSDGTGLWVRAERVLDE